MARVLIISLHTPVVRNHVGVQLLARPLHAQIFKNARFPPPSPAAIRISQRHLADNNLAKDLTPPIPDTAFTLPHLVGETIDEHFHELGVRAAQPYYDLAIEFAKVSSLPEKPQLWVKQSGWTKYYADGSFEKVDYPDDDALTFDVETMYRDNPYPVLATAVSAKFWYAWVSPWLLGESEQREFLVPLPGDKPRVIVGHNVGYDRARIAEEYDLVRTKNRFLDTMSLHNATAGLSSPQRIAWMQYRKSKRLAEAAEAEESSLPDSEDSGSLSLGLGGAAAAAADKNRDSVWQDVSSLSSLAEVARLHCGIEVDKTMRDAFSTVNRSDIVDAFDDVVSYCANDVHVTHEVFQNVFPAFLSACPSPVSFSGMLTMGNPFLPVDKSWNAFVRNAEGVFQRHLREVQESLHQLAEEARMLAYEKDEEKGGFVWEHDPWLKQLDWTPKRPRGPVRQSITPSSSPSSSSTTTEEEGKEEEPTAEKQILPFWYANLLDIYGKPSIDPKSPVAPLLFRMSWRDNPVSYDKTHGWVYLVDEGKTAPAEEYDNSMVGMLHGRQAFSIRITKRSSAVRTLLSSQFKKAADLDLLRSPYGEALRVTRLKKADAEDGSAELEDIKVKLAELAEKAKNVGAESAREDPWLNQLDWTPTTHFIEKKPKKKTRKTTEGVVEKVNLLDASWPKWYWDLYKPIKAEDGGGYRMQLTMKTRVAPLLFKLAWEGHPLYRSRQHGWIYRLSASELQNVPKESKIANQTPLEFDHEADLALWEDSAEGDGRYFKLPHKDGHEAKVGNPLAKNFVSAFEDGKLSSEYAVAKFALQMNAQCSYWISARHRIAEQLVVWEKEDRRLGFPPERRADDKVVDSSSDSPHYGLILPQVVPMGTVTRRATEKTWLAASNAKKNRVGSELKAMVRAPAGYAIVGADVDSEELWISSVMGDAQFGAHGATAIGWMTLQGTKSAGTDLHSKTASILGISREEAKVFNYSRIYGAGVRHAVQLLTQSNPTMAEEHAKALAKNLYASTKGLNTYRKEYFGRRFWYGGSESYLFNKLEEIATSESPRTPALGCGITNALAAKHLPSQEANAAFGRRHWSNNNGNGGGGGGDGVVASSGGGPMGKDFMPSRVNWVVQSSGVDYLHLLIVAVEYLVQKYDIAARYMISVHDEIRYLVKEEDKYRLGLALQVANLWTRSMFAYKLEMNDLPQVCFGGWISLEKIYIVDVDVFLGVRVLLGG
jgi:DNA polymerase gamma 1